MNVEQLAEKRATVLATARELANNPESDMAQVKSLMAEAEQIAARIEAVKALGEMAPVAPKPAQIDEPWKSGTITRNVLPGTRDEANWKAYAWGQWARSIMGNRKSAEWVKNNLKAQSEGTSSAGGYTVPDPLSSDLIYLREQFGVARRVAKIYPMSADTLNVPNATASTTVYYPGENTAITASDMTFDQVALVAKKMAVLTQVSKELAEDSIIDFGATLARDMAYVMAKEEDRVVFNSSYPSTADASGLKGIPRVLTDLASGTVANYGNVAGIKVGAAGTGAAWSGFTLANVQEILGRLPSYCDNPAWFMHKNFFYNGIADKLIALSGNNIEAIQNAYGATPTLFGLPVYFVQNMLSAPANSSCVAIVGDLGKGVAFGDRRGVTIEVSDQRYFDADQLAFKATERYALNCFDAGNYNATASARQAGSFAALFSATT